MNGPYDVGPLTGRKVRLVALSHEFIQELVDAADENRSTYGFTSVPGDSIAMEHYVEMILQDVHAGEVVAFVQIDVTSGRAVGMTRFLTLRRRPAQITPFAVEIGGTWLAASAQGTGINSEAKFLMLCYAFEEWRVGRVDLKTDDRNERSKAAIRRIGAVGEGVLRQWQPSQVAGEESLLRNTAMFSITREEWPTVKSHLWSIVR